MPNKDEGSIGTAERRKVSLIDIAKKLGGILLNDGELWDGIERREDGKLAEKKASETGSTSEEKISCSFFG
jgi:hypothetical protein